MEFFYMIAIALIFPVSAVISDTLEALTWRL